MPTDEYSDVVLKFIALYLWVKAAWFFGLVFS